MSKISSIRISFLMLHSIDHFENLMFRNLEKFASSHILSCNLLYRFWLPLYKLSKSVTVGLSWVELSSRPPICNFIFIFYMWFLIRTSSLTHYNPYGFQLLISTNYLWEWWFSQLIHMSIYTSITHWIENPLQRTSEQNNKYNYLNL